MKIVRTERVEKLYEDNGVPVHALRGIDLEVESGEFLVIAGPSGSGKTTLLNLVGALDRPTRGKVFFEEQDTALLSRKKLSRLRLTRMGFVFQAYNLIPVLSALENIEFQMMLLGIPEKDRENKALNVMSELGIRELADKRPNEMSGGQQQRVAVARAIVNNPSLVIADEPTANLDSETGAVLLDLMQKMNEERGITFIFCSHDHQVIERAKRLLNLTDGLLATDPLVNK